MTARCHSIASSSAPPATASAQSPAKTAHAVWLRMIDNVSEDEALAGMSPEEASQVKLELYLSLPPALRSAVMHTPEMQRHAAEVAQRSGSRPLLSSSSSSDFSQLSAPRHDVDLSFISRPARSATPSLGGEEKSKAKAKDKSKAKTRVKEEEAAAAAAAVVVAERIRVDAQQQKEVAERGRRELQRRRDVKRAKEAVERRRRLAWLQDEVARVEADADRRRQRERESAGERKEIEALERRQHREALRAAKPKRERNRRREGASDMLAGESLAVPVECAAPGGPIIRVTPPSPLPPIASGSEGGGGGDGDGRSEGEPESQ